MMASTSKFNGQSDLRTACVQGVVMSMTVRTVCVCGGGGGGRITITLPLTDLLYL